MTCGRRGGSEAIAVGESGFVGIAGSDGSRDDGRSIRVGSGDGDVVDFAGAVVHADLLLVMLKR